jgi:hypothetical protein
VAGREVQRKGTHASPKRWLLPTSPHDAYTQKNIIIIVTAVKTSNLTANNIFHTAEANRTPLKKTEY